MLTTFHADNSKLLEKEQDTKSRLHAGSQAYWHLKSLSLFKNFFSLWIIVVDDLIKPFMLDLAPFLWD